MDKSEFNETRERVNFYNENKNFTNPKTPSGKLSVKSKNSGEKLLSEKGLEEKKKEYSEKALVIEIDDVNDFDII